LIRRFGVWVLSVPTKLPEREDLEATMRIFDLMERIAVVVIVSAILLALGYVFVEQATYVGARSIRAIAPVLPPTYEQKVRYLAELRLRSDEQALRSIEIMEAKMQAEGQGMLYGH
jgi:hypothetical protein